MKQGNGGNKPGNGKASTGDQLVLEVPETSWSLRKKDTEEERDEGSRKTG